MFKKVCTLFVVAGFIFSGCSKDEKENLVSGAFNGTVTASVDGGSGLMVNAVLAINDAGFNNKGEFYGNVIGEGANFNNGKFTFKLPSTVAGKYLMDVTSFFEDFMDANSKGKLKVSDPSAQVADVDFIGFYVDEDEEVYVTGIFSYATPDKGTTCIFVYADSDVNITAGANVSVSLKKGWNRVYASSKLTTKAPDSMKWYFKYFE